MIRELSTGGRVNPRGEYYVAAGARLSNLPITALPIIVPAFGERADRLAAEIGEGAWITGIQEDVISVNGQSRGTGPIYSRLSLCWDPHREAALDRALPLWPNTALPDRLAQDVGTVAHFEQAIWLVGRRVIQGSGLPFGPEPEPIVDSMTKAIEAGIDQIHLHQIGNSLEGFIESWEKELGPSLP